MTTKITVLAHITLNEGVSEEQLINASDRFQTDFVNHQEGVLRRELVRKGDNMYIDIIQFKSQAHMEKVVELEQQSAVCGEFFKLMNMTDAGSEESMQVYPSISTYDGM